MKRCAGILLFVSFALHGAAAQIPIQNVYKEVGIDQNLGTALPLDLPFRDEGGNTVTLGEYFGTRPVVLSLVYYRCPMLCTEVLNGMVECFRGLHFSAGNEFTVVTVSIDPRETPEMAEEKKEAYMAAYARDGVAGGWHFLTGDARSIAALARATGFHYLYDSTSGQYAHAAGIMVATPGGKLSHYFYGVEYEPRDMRFALEEASDGKIGSAVDRLLLLCYHYDPLTGKYGPVIANVFRAGGALTILLLGGAIAWMLRRERKRALRAAGNAS
ncbi:MAG TPA: SCO family protein [Bacteroidota bacterium]|nr:SCO family protein [Bacteroidota bacterium]